MELVRKPRAALLVAASMFVSTLAFANADVEKNIANEKNWAMQAGDMYNQRYSKLKQINTGNVGKMQVAWTFSTGVLRGHEGSPLVIDGMMYIHTPFPNKVFAIEHRRPEDHVEVRAEAGPGRHPADVLRHGLPRARLCRGQGLPAAGRQHAGRARTPRTARCVWSVKNGDPKVGAVNTNAPHIFKDKVITGISGGEWGVRGFLAAYDINSGKHGLEGLQRRSGRRDADRPGQDDDLDRRQDGSRSARTRR